MNKSKVAVTADAVFGKILSIVGYIFGSYMLLVLIFGIIDEVSGTSDPIGWFNIFLIGVFLLVPPILALLKGIQIKKRQKRFKSYASLISTQQMTSIENLAASTGQSVDFVRNDLQKMIQKKFFANAMIDMAANEIVIGGKTAKKIAQPAIEMELYVCPGCDAPGEKPKGQSANCAYCGSPV